MAIRIPAPHIGLLIQSSLAYGRGLLRGIGQYVATNDPWEVYHHPGALPTSIPRVLQRWRLDGLLAQIENRKLACQLRRSPIPTVNLYGSFDLPGIPQIVTDNVAIARMVADFYLGLRYERFAYCGCRGIHYCEARCRAFVEYLGERGVDVAVFQNPRAVKAENVFDRETADLTDPRPMGRFLRRLTPPVAVMAGSDLRGLQVLAACREEGLAVPGKIAVVGVGNDEVVCNLCNPTLTSVALNSPDTGYRAAALLDKILKGEKPPSEPIAVPPLHIEVRHSAGELAVTDEDVAEAVRFIRERTPDVSVDEVARHVALSRSTLQRRFAKVLGMSPGSQILQTRLELARRLLSLSDLSIGRIAARTGFSRQECLTRAFKRQSGLTPQQFREQLRTKK